MQSAGLYGTTRYAVSTFKAILLPGGMLPADLAYGALIPALGPQVDAVAKDLELYAAPEPPPGWGLDVEVDGVLRAADEHGWERFHLLGYSGGGAVALACAAAAPRRLASLALIEPAWSGRWDLSERERELWVRYTRAATLPEDEFLAEFMRIELRDGVPVPALPRGDPPPWMARRPAGLRAFVAAFEREDIDPEALARFAGPVHFALGGLSNPALYEDMIERLRHVFGDFELELFPDRHHFDPPHRVEPERLASSLLALWRRAERG